MGIDWERGEPPEALRTERLLLVCEGREGRQKPRGRAVIRISISAAAFEAIAAVLAAFALGGCTANQMLSQPLQPLPPGTPRVVCSPFNPAQYAQTCGFYVGGHHRSH
jgi:hypothetical protein